MSFEMFERDPAEARRTFSSSLQHMAPILILGGLGVLLAKDLIALLFAADYRGSARVMPFLLFIPIMFSLSEVTGGGINYARRPRWHVVIAGLCAVLNFLLNLVLVPRFGALGAAIATGISYVLFFALRTTIAQRLLPLELRAWRLACSICVFAAACTANSFVASGALSYGSTVGAGLVVLALYRVEIGGLAGRARRVLIAGVKP